MAWRHYFLSLFPLLSVVCFTSYPDSDASASSSSSSSSSSAGGSKKVVQLKVRRRRATGRLPAAVGPRELLRVVEKMFQGRREFKQCNYWLETLFFFLFSPVNLSGWQERIDSNIPDDLTNSPADVADSNSESEEEEDEQQGTPETVMGMPPVLILANWTSIIQFPSS